MSRSEDVKGTSGEILVLAPLTVTESAAIAGQLAMNIKLLAGGTLEIGGPTGATGQTFGMMYPVSSNEIVSMNMSGKFYLWASGATCTVALLKGRSIIG